MVAGAREVQRERGCSLEGFSGAWWQALGGRREVAGARWQWRNCMGKQAGRREVAGVAVAQGRGRQGAGPRVASAKCGWLHGRGVFH
jgi:hypothetical protein